MHKIRIAKGTTWIPTLWLVSLTAMSKMSSLNKHVPGTYRTLTSSLKSKASIDSLGATPL